MCVFIIPRVSLTGRAVFCVPIDWRIPMRELASLIAIPHLLARAALQLAFGRLLAKGTHALARGGLRCAGGSGGSRGGGLASGRRCGCAHRSERGSVDGRLPAADRGIHRVPLTGALGRGEFGSKGVERGLQALNEGLALAHAVFARLPCVGLRGEALVIGARAAPVGVDLPRQHERVESHLQLNEPEGDLRRKYKT